MNSLLEYALLSALKRRASRIFMSSYTNYLLQLKRVYDTEVFKDFPSAHVQYGKARVVRSLDLPRSPSIG